MSDFQNFSHLNDFQSENFFSYEPHVLFGRLHDNLFELQIHFLSVFDGREQIFNKFNKDGFIISYNLRHVKVSEPLHEKFIFGQVGISSLEFTCLSQHRFDRSKSPIVMSLFG